MKTAILTLLTVASTVFGVEPETPDLAKRLQQGLVEEEVNRDPEAAIEHYEKLLQEFDSGRQFAATALFRTAECQRKLGDEKAATISLTRLVTLFPKQEKLVALARQNLIALGTEDASTSPELELTVEESESIKALRGLARNSPDIITGRDAQHLILAIRDGHTEAARFLLDKGANPEQQADSSFKDRPTALKFAIDNGNLRIVEMLLEAGASVKPGQFYRAIEKDRKVIVGALTQHLKEHEPDFDYTDVLRELVWFGSDDESLAEKIKSLIALGAKPDELDANGKSVFHDAAEEGNTELCRFFLEKGVAIDLKTSTGMTALDFAAQAQQPATVAFLLENGADPNNVSSSPASPSEVAFDGASPLIRCVTTQHGRSSDTIEHLLEGGASIDLRDSHGNTAMHYAATRKTENGLTALLSANPDLELRNKEALTPLDLAVKNEPRFNRLREHALTNAPDRADMLLVRAKGKPTSLKGRKANPPLAPPTLSSLLIEGAFGDVAPSNITIFPAGGAEPKHYDLIKIASDKDASFPTLSWGDLVEVDPQQYLNSVGLGAIRDRLLPHAGRKVTVKRGELETTFTTSQRLPGLPNSWGHYDPTTGIVRDVRSPLDLAKKALLITPNTSRSVAKLIRANGQSLNVSLMEGTKGEATLVDGDHLELFEAEGRYSGMPAITCDERLLYWKTTIRDDGTLADLVASAYSSSAPFVISHPDWSKLRFTRTPEIGDVTIENLDMQNVISEEKSPRFNLDHTVLNIPLLEIDASRGTWPGVKPEIVAWLESKLSFSIKVKALDQPERTLAIGPEILRYRSGPDQVIREVIQHDGDPFEIRGLGAWDVLTKAGYTNKKLYTTYGTEVSRKLGGHYKLPIWLKNGSTITIRPLMLPTPSIQAHLKAQRAAEEKSRTTRSSNRRVVLPPPN